MHLQRTIQSLIIIILFFTVINYKKLLARNDNFKTQLLQKGKSNWSVSEGWALKNGEKFFAIGIWGIPQFKFTKGHSEVDSNIVNQFNDIRNYFNIVYVQYDRLQDFMKNTILFTGYGIFKWLILDGYEGDAKYIPDKNGNSILDFNEIKYIKDHLRTYYDIYIQKHIVNRVISKFAEYDFIWYLADEPNTGFKGWLWPPSLLCSYNNGIKRNLDSTLTFLDLGGSVRGDKFLYELNYILKYSRYPKKLPYGLNRDMLQGDTLYMRTFNFSANGTPMLIYDKKKKKWLENPNSLSKKLYYQNVYITAQAYNNCSDVIGYNSYYEFFLDPQTSGLVVDAIKDACGQDKPVWLFFDGAAIKKPSSISYSQYLKNIKCQVYCSIVHGASGVLFWSTQDAPMEYWEQLKQFIQNLNLNVPILTSDVIKRGVEGKIHYSLMKTKQNEIYLIMVNVDKYNSQNFSFNRRNYLINPLGVSIQRVIQ